MLMSAPWRAGRPAVRRRRGAATHAAALARLPQGQWIDVWTGQPSHGAIRVEVEAPLDRIPMWCTESSWSRLRPIFADS